jgi:uncharacterized protein (TIGR03437 family)
MLFTIQGQNLATSTEAAPGYPLRTTLGAATVTIAASGYAGGHLTNFDVAAPLLYASPT